MSVTSKVSMIGLLGLLVACEAPTTPRYSISADNNLALRRLNAPAVAVAGFSEPGKSELTCRLLGELRAGDGLTHTQYIRKAFEDELKLAGIDAQGPVSVTLSGAVEQLDVSSIAGVTNGTWDIRLRLISSNGQTMIVEERYQFASGFSAASACPNVAQAFLPAVQNLIRSIVTSPQFPALLRS